MGKKGVMVIIFLVLAIIITIFGIIAEVTGKDEKQAAKEKQEKIVDANFTLIKEKIIDPQTSNIEKMKVNKEDTPENLSELPYVTIRSYVKKEGGSEWELSTSISGMDVEGYKGIKEEWTEEDVEKIPVIVFAISHVTGKTYKYVAGGSGNVEITTEGVNIYFYNTKTKTIFMTDELKAEKLPDSTNSSHSYTKSLFDVDSKIKTNLGRFVLPGWVVGILTIGGCLLPFVIIGVIMGMKNGKQAKKQQSKQI